MGQTIQALVEGSGGRKLIVRRENWSSGDYASVHRVSGMGESSEAFGFVKHGYAPMAPGSIKSAWTPTWEAVAVLPERADTGSFRDKPQRMRRAMDIIRRNHITSWKEFEQYLDNWRDLDTAMLELYGCRRDRQCRDLLRACMDRERTFEQGAVMGLPVLAAV